MLVDNRSIMKAKNNILFERLNHLANEDSTMEVVESKIGVPTLIMHHNGQVISYHSRYNPIREAETFVHSQIDSQTTYVLFVGVGLGYNVKALIENYPKVRFSVFEPNLEMMAAFLNHVNLAKVKPQQIDQIFQDVKDLAKVERFFDKLEESTVKIIIHPIAEKYFAENINGFLEMLKNYLDQKKGNILTELKFQTRWTMNAIANLGEVIQSPDFFHDLNYEKLKSKPVLIVSAGPSLNEELERIRTIKQEGSAYIFAVGSTVNVLINNDIMPDALFLYDPLPFTSNVVKKIKELNLNIPLIFGSTVAYEVLHEYPGKKIHFITSQDSISPELIKDSELVIVPDASTIAAVALFIIGKVQMGPIIYVGQNLSITKEKAYAEGTGHYNTKVTEEKLQGYEQVLSTTNEVIYTDSAYKDMAEAIKLNIERLGLQGKVINTTQNGLPIEGTIFMSLQEVMAKYLTIPNVVDSTVFEGNASYNVSNVVKNYGKLEQSFDALIKDYKKLLAKIEVIANAYEKKLVTNASKLIQDYDMVLTSFENNFFFEQVIVQITRQQYKAFVRDAKKVHEEKLPLKKLEKFLEIHPKYMRAAYVAINEIQPAFGELKKNELFK